MKGFEKSSVEQCSIEEQEKNNQKDVAFENYEWTSLEEAIKIVDDGADLIKAMTDLCIKMHFSPKEQKHIVPQLFPVFIDPWARMRGDKMAPFLRVEVRDIKGRAVMNGEIIAQGTYMVRFLTKSSNNFKKDESTPLHPEDYPPDMPATIMKWARFTKALTYLLKNDCGNKVLRIFFMYKKIDWNI